MNINLISLSNIKTQLGITTSTGDAAITSMIPIVSADIRRILNAQFDEYLSCTVSVGSNQVLISDMISAYGNPATLSVGTVIQSTAFAEDTYVTAYDPTTGYYTMSSVAIADATILYPTINICMQPTIAKMVWYKYTQQSVDFDRQDLASESIGGMSFSYANTEIDKRYDYPSKLIKDLGTPFARTC